MSNKFSKDKTYILDKFYKSYNREIDTLWQHSLFLTAFITGVFVAYGKVFEIVVKLKCVVYEEFISYSLILFSIAVVGIIFSFLWVCMSKASKANQEIYEAKIGIMSKKLEIDASQCTENIDSDSFFEETGVDPKIIGIVNRKKMTKYSQWDQSINNKFFSLNAGAYSVSRINILIGYVFLTVWSLIAYLHLFSFICFKFITNDKCKLNNICKFKSICYIPSKFVRNVYCLLKVNFLQFAIFLLIGFLFIWMFYHIIGKIVHSGYLEGK